MLDLARKASIILGLFIYKDGFAHSSILTTKSIKLFPVLATIDRLVLAIPNKMIKIIKNIIQTQNLYGINNFEAIISSNNTISDCCERTDYYFLVFIIKTCITVNSLNVSINYLERYPFTEIISHTLCRGETPSLAKTIFIPSF